MEELHVYKSDDAWVVAKSPEEAARLWGKCIGDDPRYYPELKFEQLPDDSELTLLEDEFDEEGEASPVQVTKTCAEWAKENGRGVLSWREE